MSQTRQETQTAMQHGYTRMGMAKVLSKILSVPTRERLELVDLELVAKLSFEQAVTRNQVNFATNS